MDAAVKQLQEFLSLPAEDASRISEKSCELMPEFDGLISKCNAALSKSQRIVKVYSWDDLDFEQVYVLPSLDVSRETFFSSNPIRYYTTHSLAEKISVVGKEDAIISLPGSSFSFIFNSENIFWKNYITSAEYLNITKQEDTIEERKRKINEIFKTTNIVYIIGGAGCGKSLFLKNLCVNPQQLEGFSDNPLLIIQGDLKRIIRPDGTFKPMLEYLGSAPQPQTA